MKISFAPLLVSLLAGTTLVHQVAAQFDDELRAANGNGNGNGNGKGNGKGNILAPEDCLAMYNPGLCKKVESIAEGAKSGNLDIEEVKVLKQLMKEAKPVDPKKKHFKEKAIEVLEKNKGQGKGQKELLLEVVDALDDDELKEWILKGIETGVGELEEGAVMEPHAGELADAVEAPLLDDRRRLGVPKIGDGTDRPNKGFVWVGGIIRYYVVLERNYAGFTIWLNHILPAMNEVEQLTGLDFVAAGSIWEGTYGSDWFDHVEMVFRKLAQTCAGMGSTCDGQVVLFFNTTSPEYSPYLGENQVDSRCCRSASRIRCIGSSCILRLFWFACSYGRICKVTC